MIPETGTEEELKQALLAQHWATCPDCGRPNQELYGQSRGRDAFPRCCDDCEANFLASLAEVYKHDP